MPKVLITGATGLLGREILRSFRKASWDVVGTGYSRSGSGITKLDLLDEKAVKALIEDEKPSIIIHSAAERSPDAVAADPERAKALNVASTTHLASLSASHGIPLLYISTDYVFPGVPGEAPYSESATPRPTNAYGELKLDGEHAVLSAGNASKTHSKSGVRLGSVLRVPVLYGRTDADKGNAESAVNVLVDKVRDAAAGREVVMDDWSRRFPTNTTDVASATVRIAARWLAMLALAGGDDAALAEKQGEWPPVLHFSAAECFTKYEMCQLFAEILELDISSMKADKEGGGGGGGGVQRPYDTQLGTLELEKLLGGELAVHKFRNWWVKELGTSGD